MGVLKLVSRRFQGGFPRGDSKEGPKGGSKRWLKWTNEVINGLIVFLFDFVYLKVLEPESTFLVLGRRRRPLHELIIR